MPAARSWMESRWEKVVFPEENRVERAENVKDVEQYISRIDEMIGRKEKLLMEIPG